MTFSAVCILNILLMIRLALLKTYLFPTVELVVITIQYTRGRGQARDSDDRVDARPALMLHAEAGGCVAKYH